MFAMFLPMLGRLLPYIIGVVLVMGAYAYVHHAGAVSQKAKDDKIIAAKTAERDEARVALKTYQDKQRAYAAQLVLDWTAARDLATKQQKDLQDERTKMFLDFQTRLKNLPTRAYIVPPDYRGLLNDAAAASGPTESAGPAPVSPGSAETATTLGAIADWAVLAAKVHKECVDQVTGWISFYRGLRTKP